MSDSFEEALALHRPELLRHCYRMLGSFHDAEETVQDALANAWKARESYTGAAPLRHWLFRIATNACLNAKKAKQRRVLPHQDSAPSPAGSWIGEKLDPDSWVTPAPDHALFDVASPADAARMLEERETIALAFVALLQRLPPRQRAVLLLKDVVGFSAEEIAEALELSVPAVSSALHRAREAAPLEPSAEMRELPAEVLREYMRCWEMRDLEGLLALLREDVIFTMPPWKMWFQGRAAVERFLTTERFTAYWSSGLRVVETRANGQPALAFYRDGGRTLHSIQILRFDGTRFTSVCNMLGSVNFHGFDFSESLTE